MEYHKIYQDYSPVKFNINQDYITRLQHEQPVNISLDQIALDNAKIILKNFINDISSRYNLLWEKSIIIENMYTNSIKLFLGIFIVLYLIAPNYNLIRVEDDNETTKFKPNMLRISLIASLIVLFYLLIQGVDVLFDIKNIIFA
jgi:hypothetical protein